MPKVALLDWNERAPLPLPRAGCAAGVVDGRLVLAGGTFWRDGRKCWSDQVDTFDSRANRWERAAPMPRPCGDAAAVAHAGSLYVFGGGADGPAESSAWVFSHAGWQPVPAMTLPEPRRHLSAAILDGVIFILGGIAGAATDFTSARATVWSAKPGVRWETRAPIPGPVRFGAAVGGIAGRIIVAGGCTPEGGNVRNLDEILAYDPSMNKWSILGRLPVASRGAWGLVNGRGLLLFGGYTDKFETMILSLEPMTGAVAAAGQLPSGLAGARFLQIGPRIIGVSGENGIKMRFAGTIEWTADAG